MENEDIIALLALGVSILGSIVNGLYTLDTRKKQEALEKEQLFRSLLVHPLIKEIRGRGLMLAAMTETPEITNEVVLRCHKRGLILFWLLFEGCAVRITPPLTLNNEEIRKGCGIIIEVLNEIEKEMK